MKLKPRSISLVAAPLAFATEEQLQAFGLTAGFTGPQGLVEKGITVSLTVLHLFFSDFVAGANEADKHAVGVNWERDAQITEVFDLRNVV